MLLSVSLPHGGTTVRDTWIFEWEERNLEQLGKKSVQIEMSWVYAAVAHSILYTDARQMWTMM
jgi:hypothetical protein